jgi:TetR/AcrR family transcriptional regulator, tetracycline repressor protein
MARPTTPLLSRQKIVTGALEFIDEVGIEKFGVYELGRRLGVKGPSLYHYFRDRDDLLDAVAVAVLDDVEVPEPGDRPWTEWLLNIALAYYRGISSHPRAAPLLMERRMGAGVAERVNAALARLQAAGVSPSDGLAIADSIEAFALIWVTFDNTPGADTAFGHPGDGRLPVLEAALEQHTYNEDSYRRMMQALIYGVAALYAGKQTHRQPPSRRRTARMPKLEASG